MRKLMMLSLVILVVFFTTIPWTLADAEDESMKVNWQLAGTNVHFVDVSDPFTQIARPSMLIDLSAKGSPGPAEIKMLGAIVDSPPSPCMDGNGLAFALAQDDMVAKFPDMSLLFASLVEGSVCVNLIPGGKPSAIFSVQLTITGGTGRFEGTSGDLTYSGITYRVGPSAELLGMTAEVKGTIYF